MSSTIHQPHDKLFKLSMGELHVAKEFLQAHLPADVLQKIDFSTLQLVKNSFVDEVYKSNEADVIYSVKLDGRTAYIYILCEHQTKPDPYMAFRLLVYMVRLMEDHHRNHPNDSLPLIYPLVVYSGEKVWNSPLEIFQLFGEQESLAREWLLKPYQLLDLHRMSDEELQKHDLSGLVTFALKYRKIRDFAAFLKKIISKIHILEKHHQGLYLGKIVLQYVVDGMQADDIELFIDEIQKLPPTLKGETMTIAEQLMERGRQQGMQQGVQQGEAALIVLQIKTRFGTIPSDYSQLISKADAQTLLKWGKKLLDAKTLDEVFYS